jgi:hypothetical protein
MSRFTGTLIKILRHRFSSAAKRYADLATGLMIIILTLIAGRELVGGGVLTGMDTTTQF